MFKVGDKVVIQRQDINLGSWEGREGTIEEIHSTSSWPYNSWPYKVITNAGFVATFKEGELRYVNSGHFMCHVEGQRGPAYVHTDIEAARTEAKRLASQPNNRGTKVYVLEAVEVVEAAKPVLPEAVVTKL